MGQERRGHLGGAIDQGQRLAGCDWGWQGEDGAIPIVLRFGPDRPPFDFTHPTLGGD
jgi:hypothetical protein